MADPTPVVREALPLTRAEFAPFGVLPPYEGDGQPTADLEFLLDDGWVNYIAHSLDELAPFGRRLCCDRLNRHDTHTQTLMPVSGDAVIVVAPAASAMAEPEDLASVRAFLLRRYECVHLARGTWHWGPYPVGAESVVIFNVQGRGYPDDNAVAVLPEACGSVVEVVLPAAGSGAPNDR